MKLRRIFAAIAACAVAATMAISASAANFTGSVKITEDASDWWQDTHLDKAKLIGDTPIDQIDYIVLKGDTDFTIAYTSVKEYDQWEWDQTQNKNVKKGTKNWYQSGWEGNLPVGKEYKLDPADLDFNADGFDFMVAISTDQIGTEYTITWEVVTKSAGGDTGSSSTTSSTANNSTTNPTTGATAGLALAGLAIAGAAVVAAKKSK